MTPAWPWPKGRNVLPRIDLEGTIGVARGEVNGRQGMSDVWRNHAPAGARSHRPRARHGAGEDVEIPRVDLPGVRLLRGGRGLNEVNSAPIYPSGRARTTGVQRRRISERRASAAIPSESFRRPRRN